MCTHVHHFAKPLTCCIFLHPATYRRHHVSTDAFDATLKLQLLLKPLSYKVSDWMPRPEGGAAPKAPQLQGE